MAASRLRVELARDGVFNVRDLGGMPTTSGGSVRKGRLLRGDALQRVRGSAEAFREAGVSRVVDLRDEKEASTAGVFDVPGIELVRIPVLDPTFDWSLPHETPLSELLSTRYRQILENFGPKLVNAVDSIAETVTGADDSAVAFHCAVGKDRTGLLAALLLGLLGVRRQQIIADYSRSSAATPIQIQWLWSFGFLQDEITEDDLSFGLWSARPETMAVTLDWLADEFGDAEGYLVANGFDPHLGADLRKHLVED